MRGSVRILHCAGRSNLTDMRKEGTCMSSSDMNLGGRLSDLPLSPQTTAQVDKRIVFGPDHFWPDYTARHFTAKAGGVIPTHSHDWPHYIVILDGEVEARIGDGAVRAGAKGAVAQRPPRVAQPAGRARVVAKGPERAAAPGPPQRTSKRAMQRSAKALAWA